VRRNNHPTRQIILRFHRLRRRSVRGQQLPQLEGLGQEPLVGPDLARLHGAAVDHSHDLGFRVPVGVLEGPQRVDAAGGEGVHVAVGHGDRDPLAPKGVLLVGGQAEAPVHEELGLGGHGEPVDGAGDPPAVRLQELRVDLLHVVLDGAARGALLLAGHAGLAGGDALFGQKDGFDLRLSRLSRLGPPGDLSRQDGAVAFLPRASQEDQNFFGHRFLLEWWVM